MDIGASATRAGEGVISDKDGSAKGGNGATGARRAAAALGANVAIVAEPRGSCSKAGRNDLCERWLQGALACETRVLYQNPRGCV
ncbi:hypothetical protein BN2476_260032 [Paraburkholderia piptadeniae]|uniref:Uncharacterized protein n=1 Tax=Paraburkholderia piptadeniae TaxID=1701573 RepID=A0A1N7S256_9BURK|nr:hypothetical protein BN2476_260032 [Paraburkholderia piptadeniae]